MENMKTMTVTELDRMYWESFGKMRNARDRKTFETADAECQNIIKELANRGLNTITEITNKIKEEKFNA